MTERKVGTSETTTDGVWPIAEAGEEVPGEVGIWILVLGDMTVFAQIFGLFLMGRAEDRALYEQSQALLSQGVGIANTLLLLTSSWFVAQAVDAFKRGVPRLAEKMLLLTIACGTAFFLIKIWEYADKFSIGITISTNDFYMYYFSLTFLHAIHVLIGFGVLILMWRTARRCSRDGVSVRTLESGAIYWHMVDLLWIMIFALLYFI